MTADTSVTRATFSFGTTFGANVRGVPSVPEPETVTLLGFRTPLLGFVGVGRERRDRKNRSSFSLVWHLKRKALQPCIYTGVSYAVQVRIFRPT